MVLGLLVGGALGLVGGVIWGVTAAASDGRLRRNTWAGIRTASTMSSDAAWLAGHRAALPSTRIMGIAAVVVGVGMAVEGVISRNGEGSPLFWTLFAIGYGGVLLAAVGIAIRASRAARATQS